MSFFNFKLIFMMFFQKYDFFHMNLEAADVWSLYLEHRRKIEAEEEIEKEIGQIADLTI